MSSARRTARAVRATGPIAARRPMVWSPQTGWPAAAGAPDCRIGERTPRPGLLWSSHRPWSEAAPKFQRRRRLRFTYRRRARSVDRRGKEKPGAGPGSLSARHTVRTGFVDKIDRERHIRGVPLPRVQPIIPTRRKEPFDHPEWLFDFKYDGFRALCYIEQGRCRFISRNGNVLSRFEALGEQVSRLLDVDDAVIDGEVIV